jgi:hypothetical protein
MSVASAPIKLLCLAAAGLAIAFGWKLGCYLGDLATGEKELPWPDILKPADPPEPLWKRKFSPIS